MSSQIKLNRMYQTNATEKGTGEVVRVEKRLSNTILLKVTRPGSGTGHAENELFKAKKKGFTNKYTKVPLPKSAV